MKIFKLLFLLVVGLQSIGFAQIYATVEVPSSDHLSINSNIITVKNWGAAFDGDYDVLKLASDSCVSGNCIDGKGRRVIATIINGNPRIRIMEGKFKNSTFLGEGVMLIDGYGKVLDGTYELGKFKVDHWHNSLQSKTIFHSKFTREDIIGNYSGYLDYGIGSALEEYRKFVICDFAPEYDGKDAKQTTWKNDLYLPARTKWLHVYTNTPAFLAARAKALSGNNTKNNEVKNTPVNTDVNFKIYCFKTNCSSNGKSFDVVSKISADLTKHPFDEVKNEAIRMIKNNSWYPNGSTYYLGVESEVKIIGVPGKDYVVSESGFYEFKKN